MANTESNGSAGMAASGSNGTQYLSPNRPDSLPDTFNEYKRRYSGNISSPQKRPTRLVRNNWCSKRVSRRLVHKNGECNISHVNIKKRRQRYLADIFTTLVDIKWRWNLLMFVMAFTLSWLMFAGIWWLIGYSHGDFDNKDKQNFQPCVEDVTDFTTALLFSIETQHTIGYGGRMMTPNCPEAIFVMMVQSCFGVIIQALMTGLVFAKLSRPKKRAETLMFTKNACVCKRDGSLFLLFRVGDMRKSHIVEAHVRAIMIKKRITAEGEVMPLYQYDVQVGSEEGEERLFLVWPVIIEHRIDKDSPFWEVSPQDLLRAQFELIVILEGIVESTGMTAQARTSYLPGEILWGHRFERLVTYQKEDGQYTIDYSRFHNTIPVDCPNYSAKKLAALQKAGKYKDKKASSIDDDSDEPDEGCSLASRNTSPDECYYKKSRSHNGVVPSGFGLDELADDDDDDDDNEIDNEDEDDNFIDKSSPAHSNRSPNDLSPRYVINHLK